MQNLNANYYSATKLLGACSDPFQSVKCGSLDSLQPYQGVKVLQVELPWHGFAKTKNKGFFLPQREISDRRMRT